MSLNQQNSLFWLSLAGQEAPRMDLSSPTKAGVLAHTAMPAFPMGADIQTGCASPLGPLPSPETAAFSFSNGLSFGEIRIQVFFP